MYFKVAKTDRYANFYVLLNGKITEKTLNEFCIKYCLNEEEKKIFELYMKREKLWVISEKCNTSERRINRILEIIENKVLKTNKCH